MASNKLRGLCAGGLHRHTRYVQYLLNSPPKDLFFPLSWSVCFVGKSTIPPCSLCTHPPQSDSFASSPFLHSTYSSMMHGPKNNKRRESVTKLHKLRGILGGGGKRRGRGEALTCRIFIVIGKIVTHYFTELIETHPLIQVQRFIRLLL